VEYCTLYILIDIFYIHKKADNISCINNMNGKKPVKAEHDNPLPPLPAAKRTLHSALTAQMQDTDSAPTEQEKLNKKSFLAAPRALMDKEGFLKMEEQITAESLYTAYKLIFERYSMKLPP
jgi:hypothetical protein